MYGFGDEILKKHRVIGIRHSLKALKKEGLVEQDVLFPSEAVEDMREQIVDAALRWYKIGARRGARVLIKAILDGGVTVQKKGRRYILETDLDAIPWTKKRIKVRAGFRKISKELDGFELRTIEDLDFRTD